METSKDRIRRELKLIAKDKNLIQCMLECDESPKRPLCKSAQLSEEFRDSGNQLYRQEDHRPHEHFQILLYYNKSIAYAPNRSEILALAFGNKSALLRHLHKYKECVCEIDKALEISESSCLRIKLLCRKAECLTALGSSENENCLQKANFFLDKLEDPEKDKSVLEKLIRKAQSVVKNNKVDKPKEDVTRKQVNKLIAKVERSSIWDSVKIDYSKIYGRHLVAARDFAPGDILTVEKPWQNYLMNENAFEYCSNCLEFLWTVVPCDSCSLRLFCSEKCKNQVWSQYHDIECSVLLRMEKMIPLERYTDIPFLISMFCRALKEAGDICELQRELESLDKRRGAQVKNYPEVEQFTSYKSVYTVPVRSIDEDLDSCVRSCTIALIGLASNTQIFNQSYSPLNLHDLRKDDVAIFVGALLLKFCTIITSGCYASKLADPEDLDDYPREPEYEKCPCGADEDPKTVSIVVTSLMTIIGCFPNVGHCVVEGNKLILFALRPIKEGEKLCSYTESSIYECTPKSERQSQHRLFYNSSCDCIACTQNWSATLQDNKKLTEICVAEIRNSLIGAQIKREIDAISKQLEACSLSLNHPDFDLLEKAKNLVFKAWTHFHMPSPLIIASTKTMKSLITNLFALPKVPRGLSGSCS